MFSGIHVVLIFLADEDYTFKTLANIWLYFGSKTFYSALECKIHDRR